MKRLVNTIKLDITLQVRNRLYHISLGLAVLLVVMARQFFDREALTRVIPTFYLLAMGGTTLLFVAGLMIFEKSENTLSGLIVTPLTPREYIGSKVITLTLLATIEATVILLLAYGLGWNAWLYVGILTMAIMLTLLGIVVVARYNSVTDFLVPTMMIALVLQMPILLLFSLHPLIDAVVYLIPTAGPFVVMLAGFETVPLWQLLYGLAYSAALIAGFAHWAQQAYDRHIVMTGGN